MKLLSVIFAFYLLLDERGFPLANDQSQEFLAPMPHRHTQHTHHHQRQLSTAHHMRHYHHHSANNYHNNPSAHLHGKHVQNSQPTTSSPATLSVNNHHQRSELRLNQHHQRHRPHLEREGDFVDYKAHLPIKTDAIFQRNSKFMPQNNRIDTQQDLHVTHARATSSTSDYDDYDYEGDSYGNENSAGIAINRKLNNADAVLFQTKQWQQPFSYGAYQDHEHARVTRDHSHSQQAYNNDYAGDEPSRSKSDEVNSEKKGELTELKFRDYGTPDAVKQTHERHLRPKTSLASENLKIMNFATRCEHPLPRVVYILNDTSKTYYPKAVLLNRCGEDTGCCKPGEVCSVKTYENVELYFFVLDLANKQTVAPLTLRNHTECECVDPKVLMQQRAKRSGQHLSTLDLTAINRTLEDDDVDYETSDTEAAANAICRCPKYFNILREDERPAELPPQHYSTRPPTTMDAARSSSTNCRCDCLNTNTPCQRLKDGEEGFSILDRKCIDDRKCILPTCSFGVYNSYQGRCPPSQNDLGNG